MKKPYKSIVMTVVNICIIMGIYPQYKPCVVENFYVSSKYIVDNTINQKTKYKDFDIRYPQVINIPNTKSINEEICSLINSKINELNLLIDEYYKDDVITITPYQIYSNYYTTKQKEILSFYIDIYQFTGGAHGITTRHAYNIDIATGDLKKLDDIIDLSKNKTKIDNEIIKQINKESKYYFTDENGFKGIDDNTKFSLEGDDIVIYYDIYEIAPYASGIVEFRIPIDSIT